MKKVLKCLAVIAAIGAVTGIIIAFLCKNNADEDLFDSDREDEDFDLDSDLQAVEREYVPLKKDSSEADAKAAKEPVKEDKEAPDKTDVSI